MRRLVLSAFAISIAMVATPLGSQTNRASQIIERWENAERWRDHVLIVAHRGGWLERGVPARAENSRASIEHAIALGVEMVEIDVRRAKGGELVVMHDSWLDRTTTCHGEVAAWTIAEMKRCRLIVEGAGATAEAVPTLRELLLTARGRILVNVDNKLGAEAIPEIGALTAELGMSREVVVKENIWNDDRLATVSAVLPRAHDIRIMPILADDAVRDAAFMQKVGSALQSDALEMIAWRDPLQPMTKDGGPLFSSAVREIAIRGDRRLWINLFSIVNVPGGPLAGGRGDKLAALADLPDEAYGFWIAHGATILQTDEPELLRNWLEANGRRVPYDLTN